MALTVSGLTCHSDGDQVKRYGYITFDSSYPTGGETLTAADLRLSRINDFEIKDDTQGYFFDKTLAVGGGSVTILVYTPSGGGTAAAQTWSSGGSAITPSLLNFTGTTSGNVTTITSGGAVVAANALAGGVLTDGTDESFILSNTALTATTGTITTARGLAATITATGAAARPNGVNSTSSVSGSAAGEVANATDLSTLTPVYFEVSGS